MAAGKVKTIVVDKVTGKRKGFGFIEPDGGGEQIFFHRSAVKNADFDALTAGDTVTYDAENSDKGPRAENVRLT